MKYNSGSNRANNFKWAERGRYEMKIPITPELCDTKSYYLLIVPITKRENLSIGTLTNVSTKFLASEAKLTAYNFW